MHILGRLGLVSSEENGNVGQNILQRGEGRLLEIAYNYSSTEGFKFVLKKIHQPGLF